MKLPNWLMYLLIIVITGAWLTSFLAGLFIKDYTPPDQINLLFSSLVGALLINAANKRRNSDDDDDESKKDDSK